jgi:catalase
MLRLALSGSCAPGKGAPSPSQRYRLGSLTGEGALASLAAIGVAVSSVIGCFAYVGGWLSPGHLTSAKLINTFEQVNGLYPGFRRNHAKGICIAGTFESNGQGVRLSKAAVFRPGRVPVIGRFALAGGRPYVADAPTAARSMVLSFRPRDGEEWRTGMNDIPVFAVTTAEAFYKQLLASQPDPATGELDKAKMEAFLSVNPETARAVQIIKATPFSSGLANATYNRLDAFRFVNAAGTSTPVRWSMVAAEPFEPVTPDQSAAQDMNNLFDSVTAWHEGRCNGISQSRLASRATRPTMPRSPGLTRLHTDDAGR